MVVQTQIGLLMYNFYSLINIYSRFYHFYVLTVLVRELAFRGADRMHGILVFYVLQVFLTVETHTVA